MSIIVYLCFNLQQFILDFTPFPDPETRNPAYLDLIDKLKSVFDQYPIQKNSLVVDLGGGTGNFTLP